MIQNESLSTKWYRARHVIKKEGSQDFITVDPRSTVEFYSPLDFELPDRQPKEPGAQERLSPVTAAANLDPTDIEKVLTFVNRWGMLGLLDHQNQKGTPVQHEPLSLFTKEMNLFQHLVADITIQTDEDWPEKGTEISNTISNYIFNTRLGLKHDAGRSVYEWIHHFPNLQAAIYLGLAMFLKEGKVFHRCRRDRCAKYFVTESAGDVFCSVRCRSAHSTSLSRKKKWEKVVLANVYNYITTRRGLTDDERTRLLELARREVDALLTQQGVGVKTIGRKVLASINEEMKKMYGENE